MKATSDFLPNLKALSVQSLLSVLLLLGLVMAQVPTAKEETRTKLTLHLISTRPDYSGPSHLNARPALLAFNKEGSLVAMSAEGKTVRLFDTANGKLKYTLRGDKWGLNGFGFSPNGQTLATRATLDHSVTLWDSLTGHRRWYWQVAKRIWKQNLNRSWPSWNSSCQFCLARTGLPCSLNERATLLFCGTHQLERKRQL